MPPTPVNSRSDADALADELVRYRLVDPDLLARAAADAGGRADALAERLVARGLLTPFQAERARAGEAALLALGPYRLTGTAGRGTFGPVFAAAHTDRADRFAVRVLPLRSLWKARQAKQLARALSAGAAHPAVAPLAEVDSANGFHYLVWPLDDGRRLSDAVEATGPLPPDEAAALLGHLAAALAACHARGVVHGALTPDCVSVGPDGLARVLELGAGALLAQSLESDEALLDSLSGAFASARVLAFAAPDLAANPLHPTAAADQYALGAVGYYALTGLAPYPHPTLSEQMRAKRLGPPPSVAVVNPDVPEPLAAVIERMMAPDPAHRFAAVGDLETALAELSLSTAPPGPSGGRSSGAISWTATGSGVLRPAARDDSDASVTFDLPDPAETLPEGAAVCLGPVPTPADTPPERPTWLGPPDSPALAPSPSPVPHRNSDMGNRILGALNSGNREKVPLPPDPRLSAPTPVQWHATGEPEGTAAPAARPDGGPPPEPPAPSGLWRAVRRKVLFWKQPRDVIQVTVFGPPNAVPGRTVRVTVFLHTPDAAANVRTLSRAFQHDAEQVGVGYLTREVARAAELAVHVSVANAGVGKTLQTFVWRGQPHKLGFDLHVPWESAEGWTPGLVSVGLDDARVGKTEFWLHVLPRKA